MKQWRRLVKRLTGVIQPVGWPDVGMVDGWATHRPIDVAPSLLAGHPPLADLDDDLVLLAFPRYRLRYLHKCRDVLRFWRFADVVDCCFNSGCRFYVTGDTQKQILQLWRDPLSFCFEIRFDERPVGFVFGGFGRAAESDALLLNGVYVRTRLDVHVRGAILDAIVESMMAPLRLDVVGVANKHGGRGPLPKEYKAESRHLLRYRALKERNARRVSAAYDDISLHANSYHATELHWRG